MKNTLLFILCLSCFACSNTPTAQFIIDKAIDYAGGEIIDSSEIRFEFRDRLYKVDRSKDITQMERIFQEDGSEIRDVLKKGVFQRFVNGKQVKVEDSMAEKYSESINSVIYFALLPYKLNDEAVIKEKIGRDKLDDKWYHLIKVSFRKAGGGKDYQDVFLYWFDQDDYSLDYLAYSFEVNGGGLRFRKAYNERFVEGIRFVNYVNYKTTDSVVGLNDLSEAYRNDQLEKVSEIEVEKVSVNSSTF